MTKNLKSPAFGAPMAPAQPSAEAISLLALRRSTPADFLTGPGPDKETLDAILAISARVPDHRRVTPFRFVLFEGDARDAFGDVLKTAFLVNEPDASEERAEKERQRFLRAPIVVAIVSSVKPDHRTPVWEQMMTAGAVCQNMLLAASAHGFAAQWLTEWYAFDEKVLTQLGLGEHEKIAGYVYIGTATCEPKERARPVVEDIVTHYKV